MISRFAIEVNVCIDKMKQKKNVLNDPHDSIYDEIPISQTHAMVFIHCEISQLTARESHKVLQTTDGPRAPVDATAGHA